MNKPIISNDFTIEDIHKIREWHFEERKRLGNDEYNKRQSERIAKILKELPKAKVVTIC